MYIGQQHAEVCLFQLQISTITIIQIKCPKISTIPSFPFHMLDVCVRFYTLNINGWAREAVT